MQMSNPAGFAAWTMEMDPTNSLLTSLTSNVSHQHHTTVPNTTVLQSLHGLQPTMSNEGMSSIMADQTMSQARFPPLPSSVQFKHHSDGSQVLKPMVSLASCDMTLSVSMKQLKVLVMGCVKQQLFQRVKFFDDDLHGHFDPNPDSVCCMVR